MPKSSSMRSPGPPAGFPSYLPSDYRRRDNIKNGFEELERLVPHEGRLDGEKLSQASSQCFQVGPDLFERSRSCFRLIFSTDAGEGAAVSKKSEEGLDILFYKTSHFKKLGQWKTPS